MGRAEAATDVQRRLRGTPACLPHALIRFSAGRQDSAGFGAEEWKGRRSRDAAGRPARGSGARSSNSSQQPRGAEPEPLEGRSSPSPSRQPRGPAAPESQLRFGSGMSGMKEIISVRTVRQLSAALTDLLLIMMFKLSQHRTLPQLTSQVRALSSTHLPAHLPQQDAQPRTPPPSPPSKRS